MDTMHETPTIDPVNALMRLYGWDSSYLALKLGMNRETVRRRLRGMHTWRPVERPALMDALDVPMEVLDMTGEQAIRWCLDQHNGWQEKRCLLSGASANSRAA
jgi:hypothetical protein